jgi:NAD(P)-dependent dehydrogenase (short-subunit alcohol dehydrogenase family)
MKTVLITGGSGGIGAAAAGLLRERGLNVALVARDEARLSAVARELGASAYACDVLDPQAFAAVVDRVEDEAGEIDGFVHAVGSIVLRPMHALSLDDFRQTFEQNATSAFIALKAIVPKMMRRKRGSIVLFSTVAVQTGLPNHEAIAAAKGAVEGITRSAAMSYARYGIRVNAVAPALTKTGLSKNIWGNEAALSVSEQMHPLGRVGEAREVAAAAVFLLSDEAAWITGQILGVDGGLSVGPAPQRARA